MNILVINGPNLNMLGIREPRIYGSKSYQDLEEFLNNLAAIFNFEIEIFQSNSEGKIIDKIHEAYFKKINAIVINPGAFTHYSYAIYDAIKATNIKTIEVHLSNIEEREDFRKVSVISPACIKTISGEGFNSYLEAIKFFIDNKNETS